MSMSAFGAYSESGGTTNHAGHVALANKIVAQNYNLPGICYTVLSFPAVANVAIALVTNPDGTTNNNGISDAVLQTAIGSIFSALAGG